eukprot:TRINITY_DN19016_c0_g1_i1.p1 TRINITY_DN19016_c0_g1~~TRINITY_DN19016_c0_g1_i1.p1  ORF type:complete len:609 (+),score=177.76 TRINITY_DN19016_c0_g1_i1:100-1827(+)
MAPPGAAGALAAARRVCRAAGQQRAVRWQRRAAADGPARKGCVRVLHVNDVYELENLPRLAALRKQLRPDAVVLSGDFMSPSVLSSLDKGRSTIAALNAAGVTHCCLGNHEADFPVEVLQDRVREFAGVMLSANVVGLDPELFPRYDIVRGVAFVGLLSAEPGMFRDGTFKGLAIRPPVEALREVWETLPDTVKTVVPVTHQSWAADSELATTVLRSSQPGRQQRISLVLGGHDHDTEARWVGTPRKPKQCLVLKSGTDAQEISVVDIRLPVEHSKRGIEVEVEHRVSSQIADDPHTRDLVERLAAPVRQLQTQVIIRHDGPLSSKGARLQQTSLGQLLCTSCRSELEADVCLINGGPIKGERDYPEGAMSLLDLQQELPFPTKLVLVDMPGRVLREGLRHARRSEVKGGAGRRGYLQHDDRCRCDADDVLTHAAGEPLDDAREYLVALPRNLLAGFCNIVPFVSWAKDNPDRLPHEEMFHPALSVVLRWHARELWVSAVGGRDFDDFDRNKDGVLDQEELREALTEHLGSPPSDALLAAVTESIDSDRNATICAEEFARARAVGQKRLPALAEP